MAGNLGLCLQSRWLVPTLWTFHAGSAAGDCGGGAQGRTYPGADRQRVPPGTGIYKALALGAKAVCLARAVRWSLEAYGVACVRAVLEILQAELILAR